MEITGKPEGPGKAGKAAGWLLTVGLLPLLLAGCLSGGSDAELGSPQAQALEAILQGESGGSALQPFSACEASGLGTDHRVGPGQTYTELEQVPWESLRAGDTVRIFHRAEPYRGKFMLAAQGTAAAPVRVCGVRSAAGERPTINGSGAVSRPTLAGGYSASAEYRLLHQARSLILIKPLASAADAWTQAPSHIQIDGLRIVRAHPDLSFTDVDGVSRRYEAFGACIWIERGRHITLADNEIADCQMGVFSKSTDDNSASVTRDLRLIGNHIHGHGIRGSDRVHATYTQGVGTVIEFNRYGAPREGALGNAIKDRSAGLTVRHNRIEEGAHALDLVEAEDFPKTALATASYRETHVHGNVIIKRGDTGTTVHYGGDHYGSWPGAMWGEPIYRKGTLHFYDNLVELTGSSAVLFQISTTEERVQAWNNIVVYAPTVQSRLLRADQDIGASWTSGGIVTLGADNRIVSGWRDTSPWHPVGGQLIGAERVTTIDAMPADPAALIAQSGGLLGAPQVR